MNADRSFLADGEVSESVTAAFDADRAREGFVMNLTRVWAHVPEMLPALRTLMLSAAEAAGLTLRQRAVLVTAMASALGDSYCSLAWGSKLAAEAGPAIAGSVVGADDTTLPPHDRALACWARRVATNPNAVVESDVGNLRRARFDDRQIAALTMFVALRLAFSTLNGALGIRPDVELVERAPDAVRDAVTFGREPAKRVTGQRASNSAAC
jgi:uncharacterized peroxidase-related enzyme